MVFEPFLFDLKTGIDCADFGLGNWFSRKLRECVEVFIVSIPNGF